MESGINKKTRVLWFTSTASKYDQGKHHYNGCGWIESLEEQLKKEDSIELAISFFHKINQDKAFKDGTTYYPILRKSVKKEPFKYIWNTWRSKLPREEQVIPQFLQVIDDFKPDVIHIFGTEEIFASMQTHTKVPVVIHLQGLLNPYENAYFPVGHSLKSFFLSPIFLKLNLIGFGRGANFKLFQNAAKREAINLRNAKFVMGRTEWDKRIAKIYNPEVQYFHVDEVLRPIFYQNDIKINTQSDTITIISTLSSTIYKGIDLVLKTASILKTETSINFEWKIIGFDRNNKLLKYFITSTGIIPEKVDLKFVGKKSPDDLIGLLNEADIFVHPSYIDNSPNSVCEAQISGVPVIACNVGGIASLIEHKESGILVPSNGVFELVSWIVELSNNSQLLSSIAQKGKLKAQLRHNQTKIVQDLVAVYKAIQKF